jgi:hypothetical protein
MSSTHHAIAYQVAFTISVGVQVVSSVEQIFTDADNASFIFASIADAFIIQSPFEEIVFFMFFVGVGLGSCGGWYGDGGKICLTRVRPKALGGGIEVFFSRSL